MKKIILMLVVICCSIQIHAQGYQGYYYAEGRQIHWTEDQTSANIIIKDTTDYNRIVERLQLLFSDPKDEVLYDDDDDNIIINSYALKTLTKEYILDYISVTPDDIVFFTYSKVIDNSKIWLRNEVLFKLKDQILLSDIQPVLARYNITDIQEEGDQEYSFLCHNETVLVEVANVIYTSGYVIYSTPDFYSDFTLHSTDPMFSKQYYLHNTGQIIANSQGNSGPATLGMDISAPEAWNFVQAVTGSIGRPFLSIAVLDDGVEDHEDLRFPGLNIARVAEGYTPNTGGKGKPKAQDFHGQCCAGVIAASHNSIGIAGVAPNSIIIPIKIIKRYGFCTNKNIAKAIKKATEMGVWIMNNSWGGYKSNDAIKNAFAQAISTGRNGKGCIVVASSGNDSRPDLAYPAKYPGVISVGAVNKYGVKTDYSNSGPELDLMAFGGDVIFYNVSGATTYDYDICSIDRTGGKGKVSGNYYDFFGGTSAAAPQVSGVAALMLSVNPALTSSEVTAILQQAAKPRGERNLYGYGIVNAYGAVVESYFWGSKVSGSSSVTACEATTYAYDGALHSSMQIEWISSPHFAIIAGQGTSNITVKAITSSLETPYIQANIILSGQVVKSFQKNISVIGNGYNFPLVSSSDYTVEGNTLWNESKILGAKLTINPGCTLTINANLYCASEAEIIVQPNATLIIDGATLTNACDEQLWQGIKLLGDASSHQIPSLTGRNQGVLYLKNGAVIAHAVCGIKVWDGVDINTSGGIVYANNTTFLNNTNAVEFAKYANWYHGSQFSNRSSFTNCTFQINDSYMTDPSYFKAHVKLYSVQGITFSGCRFFNQRTNPGVYHQNANIGILALDAGFNVKASCAIPLPGFQQECPENELNYSVFEGFTTGISANNSAANFSVSIDHALFDRNRIGVKLESLTNASVLRSNFKVGYGAGDMQVGLSLANSTGFRLEENTFTGNSGGEFTTTGLKITNSGANNNQTYKNYFHDLSVGQQFIGANYDPVYPYIGLQALCNEHADIAHSDIHVKIGNGGIHDGIRSYQGVDVGHSTMSSLAAGNLFSATAMIHFKNDAYNHILYQYTENNPDEKPENTTNLELGLVTVANECKSKIKPSGIFEIADKYTEYSTSYKNLLYNYNELIDDGNTADLLETIQGAWADDIWKIRQELLAKSPYLSEEVLMEVAKNNLLPQAIYLEICIANVDATRNKNFLDFLRYDIPYPIPEYMLHIVEANWSTKSIRTELENRLAYYSSEKDDCLDQIALHSMTDSLLNKPHVRTMLLDRGYYSDYFTIAEGYIEEDNYSDARSIIYDLTVNVSKLSDEQETEIEDFKGYIDFRENLYVSAKNIYQLNMEDIDDLVIYARAHTGRGQILAKNILCVLYDICLDDIAPKSAKQENSSRFFSRTSKRIVSNSQVEVIPNPAQTYTSFKWDFGSLESKAVLKIFDQTGKQVVEHIITFSQGQWVWDTQKVPSGVYTYSVVSGSLMLGSGKVIVKK